MRHVAVGLICDEDYTDKLLTAWRRDHDGHVELLGGEIRGEETPLHAVEREIYEETGVRATALEHVTTWETRHDDGEPIAFDVVHARLLVGGLLVARELETHDGVAFRSLHELRRTELAPALGRVVKWMVDGELTRMPDNGFYRWEVRNGIRQIS